MFPILICSKGRAGQSNILTELNNTKSACKLFIEPNEIKAYKEYYPNLEIINIKENDRGLVFVREYIFKYALKNKYEWYWCLDDDIKFYEVIKGKTIPIFITRLNDVEKYFTHLNSVGQVGLQYSQFAWSAKKQFSFNSYCDCFVANRVEAFKKIKFDYNTQLKIDRDLTLQVLSQGYKTLMINRFCFSSPKNGSNKGGLFDEYKSNREEQDSLYMVNKWPGICTMNYKKDGRPDVKINWKAFSQIN